MADTNRATPSTATVERRLTEILDAATVDADLRRRLREDPAAALAGAGMPVPDGVSVEVEEAAADELPAVLARCSDDRLVLPLPPFRHGAVSDEDLEAVAGGGPLAGLWNAVTLPFNLATRFMNSNSGHGLGDHANDLANAAQQAWNNPNTP